MILDAMTQVGCGQGLSPGGLHGLAPGEAVGKEPETKNQETWKPSAEVS